VPHGDAACAVGTASAAPGKPNISPVSMVPLRGRCVHTGTGSENDFAEYNRSTPSAFRTSPNLLAGISQDIVTDPSVALRHALHNQILETDSLSVMTHRGGGVNNIPFITTNANAVVMNATFWIERIQGPQGDFLQRQYAQTVLVDFGGLNWPHVSVAKLPRRSS
jgi:hypothetical protein